MYMTIKLLVISTDDSTSKE
jgi:hypothetical protein